MSDIALTHHLAKQLEEIRAAGTFKSERVIESAQGADINVAGKTVINLCANNYLGLANHPEIVKAAHAGLDKFGFGMASVRFICGTAAPHKLLEKKIAQFFQKEDSITYNSCFDANGGLFETVLSDQDAIISDELNHASIIDGIRLCKAQRHRYKHSDMTELEAALKATQNLRFRMIATDGVFSMDGDLAKLDQICELADKYKAVVMVDECHASGFLGETGRGTPEVFGVMNRIDVITSTLGKTLSGGVGGFTTSFAPWVETLRQRSRPYLFSNAMPPSVCFASMKALELIDSGAALRKKLQHNARFMREGLTHAGFQLKPGNHPIIPVMLGDAKLASTMADKLLKLDIYVIGFSYPVVPMGQARIRMQLSAAHEQSHLDQALAAFISVGKELGVIR
ncbi:MAG TPA: glycine C-acetyltransferase [Gemmatales bacterium]|nr:glycine C-acetyltransferase [Gemmatales bacterium]